MSQSAIKAGQAYVELATKNNKLVKGLNSGLAQVKKFGAGVTASGLKVAAGGSAVLGPLLGAVKMFADAGGELADMSQRTGLSVESLSELGFAARQSGTDLETVEKAAKKMQQNITAAAEGSDSATATLDRLGFTAHQLASMAPDEQFTALGDAISKIQDPALRTSTAMDVFGKAGTSLLPMFADGAAGVEELRAKARALGLTMDGDAARGAEAFGDQVDTIWEVGKKLAMEIGAALLPDLKELATTTTSLISGGIAWVKNNQAIIATVARIAAAVVAVGFGLALMGGLFTAGAAAVGGLVAAFGLVGSAVGTIIGLVGFLISPIGLAIAAVAGLAAYFLYSTGAAQDAAAFIGDALGGLVTEAKTAFGAIGQALAGGNIGLAAKILWLTIKMEWQKGIAFLNAKWQSWKAFFLQVVNSAIYGAAGVFVDGWAMIQTGAIETVDFIADAWALFVGGLSKTFNTAIGFIRKAWVRLKALFDADINVEAETSAIDAETTGKNAAVDNTRNNTIGEREKKRRADEAKIEADRKGAADILEADRAREAQRINDAAIAAASEGADELAAARAEWDASIKEAAETPTSPDVDAAAKKQTGQAPDPSELDALAKDKVDVSGTFNAAIAGNLGAASVSERTAKATEETAKNTKKLLKTGGTAPAFT